MIFYNCVTDAIQVTMDANRLYWAEKIAIDIPLPVSISIGKDWGNMN